MAKVIVIGAGLAGLASAAALADAGLEVEVFESRPFPGGRATSYPWTGPGDEPVLIDNCQHVLLRCCTNLLDFYDRLGVGHLIRFFPEYYFLEPGGGVSVLRRGSLPAPLHFAGSFFALEFLRPADKWAIARALGAASREYRRHTDLEAMTMLEWLREKRQTERAIEFFWKQVLVSALNEELDRVAACHGLQVMFLGFLAARDSYEMGIPAVPLRDLYRVENWRTPAGLRWRFRMPVERVRFEGDRATAVVADSAPHVADYFVCAVPFERVAALAPELEIDWTGWEHSPITGIHLWFDRPVTELPHATLLGRTIQWFFNKNAGRYLQVVVSASRRLIPMERGEVVKLACAELSEFLPRVGGARLEKAHVVKETRATFSPAPGIERRRPPARTRFRNFFLAGDWTRSGWPATMEGAVRSGYLAAEAVCQAAGHPRSFLCPDVA